MSVNKVVYGKETLIDLTEDTVTEENLLNGCTAHKADGTIITGTLLSGYPAEFILEEEVSDSSGQNVQDGTGSVVKGRIKYQRA